MFLYLLSFSSSFRSLSRGWDAVLLMFLCYVFSCLPQVHMPLLNQHLKYKQFLQTFSQCLVILVRLSKLGGGVRLFECGVRQLLFLFFIHLAILVIFIRISRMGSRTSEPTPLLLMNQQSFLFPSILTASSL